MLCILNSERVLRTMFSGRYQFFDAKTTFCVILSHKMCKIMQKITKIMFKKEAYQHLGITLKSWLTPKRWLTPEKKSDF